MDTLRAEVDVERREVQNPEHRGPAGDEDPVQAAKGLGGVTGAAAGAGLGSILGPAGIIVGGIAGAVGGWWAGRGVSQAAGDFSDETDEHYRRLHEQQHAHRCDYEAARYYYRLGNLARRNPDYRGRSFDDVEQDLRRGWPNGGDGRFREWEDVRPFVSCGYEQAPRD